MHEKAHRVPRKAVVPSDTKFPFGLVPHGICHNRSQFNYCAEERDEGASNTYRDCDRNRSP